MSLSSKGLPYDNRLEVVVVCLNYGDFLAETLPYNISQVDRLVVVTHHDDNHTKEVCRKWSVECVLTDVFYEWGNTFEKGAAINMGLGALRQRGWILQLDADIVLPLTARNMLDKSGLQRDYIYGAERCNLQTYEQWKKFRASYHTDPQFGYQCMVNSPSDIPIGANLVHKQYGYCPIGYFQLWHSEYMHKHEIRYPETHGSAEETDVQWTLRWPRNKRVLLPTLRVFHLESEPCAMGTNWCGRKTKPFTEDGNPPPSLPCPPRYGY